MFTRLLFALAALLAAPLAARAQIGTANQTVLGYQTVVNCPGGNTPCWIPYDTTGAGIPVTGGGGGGGGTSAVDEAAFTAGTTAYTPVGGIYSTGSISLTSGQAGALRLTADRNAMVDLNEVNGTALGAPSAYGTSPGAVTVMGVNAYVTNTLLVSQSGTWTVQPGNTANSTAWLVTGTGGTFPITAASLPLPTGAATAANQSTEISSLATIATNTGAAIPAQSGHGTLIGAVEGVVASGSTAGTYPLTHGGRAQNAEATAVTNGQAVVAAFDLVGKQVTSPYANKENLTEGAASVTGTSSTSLVGAPGANLFIYVTSVDCFNSGSTTTTVSLQNGSGGTVIWEGVAAASGGGFTKSFPTAIGGVNNMTANTALYFQAGSSTTTLYCNASGYKGT